MESLSKLWNMSFFNKEDTRLNNLDETFTSFRSTPLHIAVMSGDIKFATKILSKPEGPNIALKQDSNGFTPLHLASVRTSIRMVRLLLQAEPGACIVQDEDGRTPLHLAAMMNRVDIMKLLMEEGLPEAIHIRNAKETILHLCVKSNTKLKTLKLLAGYLVPAQPPYPNTISIDSTDNDDNTILHLAVEMGNTKITNYLLLDNNVRINKNIENKKGLKALNMLSQAQRNDLKFGFYGCHIRHDKHKSKTLSKDGDHEGLKDRINALMVVATLIAGIAFQAAMNPPGGVWQDDSKVNSSTDPVIFAYYLEHMFSASISGGLDSYIKYNLRYPANVTPGYWNFRPYNSTIEGEKQGINHLIEKLVKNLRKTYLKDFYYRKMTSKGLILEDFLFTDVVSFYNGNATNNTNRGGFFPYIIRYAGTPILAYTWPNHYVVYMVTNGAAFFASLTIIFLAMCGFMMERSVTQVRILIVLMCISIGCIASSYLSILVAMMPGFYVGISIFVIFQVFLGVCCMLGVGYFIWTLTWKIVKLRKRTRHYHIGVVNYLKALFFSMDAKDAGKLVLFIVAYSGFRINGYIYYMYDGGWSHINPFLY
ncbi:hypothetical protein MKW98_000911 [Papaver atlanticum]|uniref:PGG domain-containing protein n=1 Tax=Papaver atlanticum TaxID=357466 RepID=A0AAD4SCZ5_9MAGN|nr:hypothetical protein MKW98_000911 [Papaver atlanticum]